MEVKGKDNNEVIAVLGEVFDIHQVQVYLKACGVDVPDNQILLSYSIEEATEGRRQAYSRESDPLYLEWQYDKTSEKELTWRNKVAEIKARYPFPAKSAVDTSLINSSDKRMSRGSGGGILNRIKSTIKR
ncbi:hypothetical protein [Zooshikella ganghwensis]|uniref:hypothetical protein n=1 Tax=Zooshikella ganghwensis TaxID=202772 RepID=UPI00040CAEBF|nr:hypothetical protein [Zooshikella ganghwensis]